MFKFGKRSIQVFCPFKKSGYLSYNSVVRVFYVLGTNPVSDMRYANISSQCVACLSLNDAVWSTKVWNFNEVPKFSGFHE